MSKEYPKEMHTAEHVLSGTMIRFFGCGRPVTTHLEKKKSKVDFAFRRNLTEDELLRVQTTVNEVLARHLPVREEFMTREDAAQRFDLSRLPDEVGNTIRIVTVGDYDACPCIGGHVTNTSEIKPLRIISTSHEDGVLRVRFKLG